MRIRPFLRRAVSGALVLGLLGLSSPVFAEEAPAPVEAKPAGGDARRITFEPTFADALAKAKREKRLLFLKPIYGGVDAEGAKDYRCGSW